jgi:dynactin complex subunit
VRSHIKHLQETVADRENTLEHEKVIASRLQEELTSKATLLSEVQALRSELKEVENRIHEDEAKDEGRATASEQKNFARHGI